MRHKINPKDGEKTRFSSTRQPANNPGRPKKLLNQIAELPKDGQNKIYAVLVKALEFDSIKEATAYLKSERGKVEYGIVLEVAIKAINSAKGLDAIMAIIERVYGRPRETKDIDVKTDGKAITSTAQMESELKNIVEKLDLCK